MVIYVFWNYINFPLKVSLWKFTMRGAMTHGSLMRAKAVVVALCDWFVICACSALSRGDACTCACAELSLSLCYCSVVTCIAALVVVLVSHTDR